MLEGLEVCDQGNRIFLRIEGPLHDALAQPPLPLAVATIENRAHADQRRCGDDEPGRLDEADPLEMIENRRVEFGHGLWSLLLVEKLLSALRGAIAVACCFVACRMVSLDANVFIAAKNLPQRHLGVLGA